MNVLSKDGSMKIQVGANDGETITIDLKKIDSDTLNLAGFNVNGEGETANTAATLKDMVGLKLDNTGSLQLELIDILLTKPSQVARIF